MTLIFSRLCTRYRGVQCHSCDVLNQVSRDAMSFIDPTKNQFARYFIPNFEGIKRGIFILSKTDIFHVKRYSYIN